MPKFKNTSTGKSSLKSASSFGRNPIPHVKQVSEFEPLEDGSVQPLVASYMGGCLNPPLPHSPGALAHVWEDGDALKPHLPHLSWEENLCLSSGPWKTGVSIPGLQHGSLLCIMGGKTNCTRAVHLNPTPSHPWCSSSHTHCADGKVCAHKVQDVNTQDGY